MQCEDVSNSAITSFVAILAVSHSNYLQLRVQYNGLRTNAGRACAMGIGKMDQKRYLIHNIEDIGCNTKDDI